MNNEQYRKISQLIEEEGASLTTQDLVDLFGVSRMTVSNWATSGILEGAKGPHDRDPWRFSRGGVQRFLNNLTRVTVATKNGRQLDLGGPYGGGIRDIMGWFQISKSAAHIYLKEKGAAPGAIQLPGERGRWRLPEGWRKGAATRVDDPSLKVQVIQGCE